MASGIHAICIEIQPQWWHSPLVWLMKAWVAIGLPLTPQTVERIVARSVRWRVLPEGGWRTS